VEHCNLCCKGCTAFSQLAQEEFLSYEGYCRDMHKLAELTEHNLSEIMYTGGEPLLHPQIADMVAYVTERQVADRVEIVTNGMLLTHELSDKLIDAGLKRLRISVDGLSSEDYMRYCGVQMDFEQFVEQIQYFYAHKKETSLYIKIINYMVSQPEQRKKFYDIF